MRGAKRWPPALALLLSLPAAGGAAAAQQASWLPPRVAEGAAQQLAERMRLLSAGESDGERVLAGARELVDAIAGVITEWGVDGVLARAPEQTAFEIPSAGDRYLDAMARYQVCNLLLFVQLQDPAFQDDANAKVTSVFGLSAVTLALLSLREPFLADGGDETAIEAHLTGPALEPALAAVQGDPEARASVEERCGKVVVELIEEPLARLRPGASP